ncbi:MAG: cyclic nucleotide-binding domain-containing protein [Deltaproteobacteria bacterium]|nr:cyclic nucleotide-binding domain-containing protein [Deltaproteobacteria bacterium]
MVDAKLLRNITFFAELDDKELECIAGVMKLKEFKIGDTVFNDNEKGEDMYIIKKGEVKACKTAPDGELFTLTLMKEGDIFGEMSFLDGRPHSATIIAIGDLEVFVVNRDDFEGIVETSPWAVYKFLRNVVFSIHSIVRGMNTRYVEMINYMWGRKR